MPLSVRQTIEARIKDLQELIEPELKEITHLEETMRTIEGLQGGRPEITTEKKRRLPIRTGKKKLVDYVREYINTPSHPSPFRSVDIVNYVKAKHGTTLRRYSLCSELSRLSRKTKEIRRVRLGWYEKT